MDFGIGQPGGYSPISLDEGLASSLGWFRGIGKLDNG